LLHRLNVTIAQFDKRECLSLCITGIWNARYFAGFELQSGQQIGKTPIRVYEQSNVTLVFVRHNPIIIHRPIPTLPDTGLWPPHDRANDSILGHFADAVVVSINDREVATRINGNRNRAFQSAVNRQSTESTGRSAVCTAYSGAASAIEGCGVNHIISGSMPTPGTLQATRPREIRIEPTPRLSF